MGPHPDRATTAAEQRRVRDGVLLAAQAADGARDPDDQPV